MRKPTTAPPDARRKPPYGLVFGSPDGGLVLRDIMKRGALLSTAFDPSVPGQTEYNLGRQSLALEILQELRWSEAEILALTQERLTPEQAADLADTQEDDEP